MAPLRPSATLTSGRTFGILAVLVLLAACAQPQESAVLYDTSRENTRRDAQDYVMGEGPRATSQIQLGFGSTGPAESAGTEQQQGARSEAAPASAAIPRPLAEARSFLGTVPCPSGMACDAARFMVTLAPSGEWRSRTTLLVADKPGQILLDQGCWDIIDTAPLRIALVQPDGATAMGDFTFVNGNTLRVNILNGAQPMLEHRLTRQADLDPIDELKDRPTLNCP